MLNIIIVVLIIITIVVHRHLSDFWEQGLLPYERGFLIFANIFVIIYLLNFIWMFGFLLGIAITILTFFQIIFYCFLWLLVLPKIIKFYRCKTPTDEMYLKTTTVNPFILGAFSFLVIALGLLTIINFFVSDYASLTNTIVEFFEGNYIVPILCVIGIAVLSNVIRIYTHSKLLKKFSGKNLK